MLFNKRIAETSDATLSCTSESTARANILKDTRILENLHKVTEIKSFMNRECKKHTKAIRNDTFAI
jgi:hypothetical protein